jgi:hypothetical protein
MTIYKKDGEIDYINYTGISLSSTMFIILYNILLSKLTPYEKEIIGGHQCGFRCNRSSTDQNSPFVKCLRKIGNTLRLCISYL